MKYYLHDTNAFQDQTITERSMCHGYGRLGLGYTRPQKRGLPQKRLRTAVLKKRLKEWYRLDEPGLITPRNTPTASPPPGCVPTGGCCPKLALPTSGGGTNRLSATTPPKP